MDGEVVASSARMGESNPNTAHSRQCTHHAHFRGHVCACTMIHTHTDMSHASHTHLRGHVCVP